MISFIYVNLEADMSIISWEIFESSRVELLSQRPIIQLPAGGKITVSLPKSVLSVRATAEIGFAGSLYKQTLLFTRIQ